MDEAIKEVELQPNIMRALDFIKKKGLKMAIVSYSNSEKIKEHIKPLEISHYFDLVLGGNDVKHRKPHPEIAKLAMKFLKVKPKETLLIGDNDFDVETGKNAKTFTALYTGEKNRAFTHPDYYRKLKPDFEFQDFSELPEKISHLL